MKLHHVEKEHRNFLAVSPVVSSQISMASVQSCRALHYISKKSKIITLEFKAKNLHTKYENVMLKTEPRKALVLNTSAH